MMDLMSQSPLQPRRGGSFDGKENSEHRTRCSVTGKIMSTLFERKESRQPHNEAFGQLENPQTQRHSMTFMGRKSASLPPSPSCSMEEHLAFVRGVIDSVLAQLPEDVREGHFEDAVSFDRARQPLEMGDEENEPGDLKVSTELYKKLFGLFDFFLEQYCEEGIELVAEAVEALLKLRVKRVHASLLKTYLPTVIRILGHGKVYPSLRHTLGRTQSRQYLSFSPHLSELCRQSAMLEDLMDAIVAPCDEDTFAGVLQYAEKLKTQIADTVITDDIVFSIGNELKELASNAQEKAAVLWKTLYECISMCCEYLPNTNSLVHAIQDARLVGVICHALVLKPPSNDVCQRLAATCFHRLCQDDGCLKSICATVVSYAKAWEYILPSLYCGDISVETEMADALQLMIESKYDGLHETICKETVSHCTMCIIESPNASSLIRVILSLILEDPNELASTDEYYRFHQTMVRACVQKLSMGLRMKGQIPLIQYIDTIIASHSAQFASLMLELNVLRLLEDKMNSDRTRGILYGVCAQPLARLNKSLGFI